MRFETSFEASEHALNLKNISSINLSQ